MNIIKVVTIIILNYRYGINIIEQCDTYQIVIIFTIWAKTRKFSYCSSIYNANIEIISIYLNAYKTIEDIYGT